jgi:hypothetical protein
MIGGMVTIMGTTTAGERVTTRGITDTVAMMITAGGIPIAGGVGAKTATDDASDRLVQRQYD